LNRSKASTLAWTLFAIVAAISLLSITTYLTNRPVGDNLFNVIEEMLWSLVGVEFAFLAALIVSRQPGNIIGRLMMILAAMGALDFLFRFYLEQFPTAPAEPTVSLLLVVYYTNLS